MMIAHQLTVMVSHPAGWGWWGAAGSGHAWGGWFWIWPLAWLALWAVVAGVLAWYLIVSRRRSPLDDARRILADRYARGELSVEEYRERLSQLR